MSDLIKSFRLRFYINLPDADAVPILNNNDLSKNGYLGVKIRFIKHTKSSNRSSVDIHSPTNTTQILRM